MVKKNRKIIIFVLLFLIIGIGIYFNFGFKSQAVIPYDYQCSPDSCPSGYSSIDEYCDSSRNKCYIECEKVTSGGCGSYGSFSVPVGFIKLGWTGKDNNGQTYSTPSYFVNDDYCYKFYPKTSFRVDKWGTADSYSLYTTNTWDTQTQCSTNTNDDVTANVHTLGRGTDGSSYTVAGSINEYGGSTCSGGQPIFHTEGKLSVDLYVSKAPWIEENIITTTKSCSYDCDENDDCDDDEYIESAYCKDDNVYQKYREHECASYECSYSDSNRLRETCVAGCANGVCIAPCKENDIIQRDTGYYICKDETYKLIIDVIELPWEEQQRLLDLINTLNFSIGEKTKIIKDLTSTLDGQIIMIEDLTVNIVEQAQLIAELEVSLATKIAIVTSLTSEIDKQAILISQLKINLEEKIYLISQLTSVNEEQAELISLMKLSFSDQADIINGLNKEIEDDAEIINSLELSTDEQAILINEMDLTLEEDIIIINALELSLEESAIIIQALQLSVADEQVLIEELTRTIVEQEELINAIESEKEELKDVIETEKQKINYIIIAIIGVIVLFVIIIIRLLIKRRGRK